MSEDSFLHKIIRSVNQSMNRSPLCPVPRCVQMHSIKSSHFPGVLRSVASHRGHWSLAAGTLGELLLIGWLQNLQPNAKNSLQDKKIWDIFQDKLYRQNRF